MTFRTRDYNATVLDHYRNPRCAGGQPVADTGLVGFENTLLGVLRMAPDGVKQDPVGDAVVEHLGVAAGARRERVSAEQHPRTAAGAHVDGLGGRAPVIHDIHRHRFDLYLERIAA